MDTSLPRKKLFLNYSTGNQEDVKMYNNLSLHLSVIRDRIDPWSVSYIKPGDEPDKEIQQNFEGSDAIVHLLSINFENDNQCLSLLLNGIKEKKQNIPILISSFDWESDTNLAALREQILPHPDQPIDTFSNPNLVFKTIIQALRAKVLGDSAPAKMKSDRTFYYIFTAVILAMGVVATSYAQSTFGDFRATVLVALMFLCIALFIIRKVLFPTNISTYI